PRTTLGSRSAADGQGIAARACQRWDALRRSSSTALPAVPELSNVREVANEATNDDLEFVVLRDHVEVARLAVHNGDAAAWRRAAAAVDADCTHLREGTYRQHLNDRQGSG